MSLSPKSRTPPSLLLAAFPLLLLSCRVPPPLLSRAAEQLPSRQPLAWTKSDVRSIGYPLSGSPDTMFFVYIAGNPGALTAVHADTGQVAWSTQESGVRGLGVSGLLVLSATPTDLNAHNQDTGLLIWTTPLGIGHVSVILQAADQSIRIYYGQRILEVDPANGAIIRDTPLGDVLWIQGRLTIHASPDGAQVWATSNDSGALLWTSHGPPFLREEWSIPVPIGTDALIVHVLDRSICSLSLATGAYTWCTPEAFISNPTVSESGRIHALNTEFILESIDPASGELSQSVQFSPSHLPEDLLDHGFWYSVATSHNMVSVLFGDSWQLFALAEGP